MSTLRLFAARASFSAAVLCSLALPGDPVAAPSLQQETRPNEAEPAAPVEQEVQALTDESRERVDLIRSALQQGDGEGGREFLRETVAALAEPHPGGESAHIAFLLELDRLARELGSLEESRHVCAAS
jgi:hypothetical protein